MNIFWKISILTHETWMERVSKMEDARKKDHDVPDLCCDIGSDHRADLLLP